MISECVVVGNSTTSEAHEKALELNPIQSREIEMLREKNALLVEQLEMQGREIALLKKSLHAAVYGRRSERDIAGQLGLPFAEQDAEATAIEATPVTANAEDKPPPSPEKPKNKRAAGSRGQTQRGSR